ncbi:MAG: hypothetical protein ACYS8W_02360 [Planctomycetota bacterium]
MKAAVNSWQCSAVPIKPGTTGDRGFIVDQTGVIRFTSDGAAPTTSSPALDY